MNDFKTLTAWSKGFRWVGGAALVLALTATGCLFSPDDKSDPDPEPLPDYLEPTSPENVLSNFETAHVRRDIDGYLATLSDVTGDTFRFRSTDPSFDELDLDRDEETMRNMFDEVLGIEIRLDHSGSNESEYVTEFPPADGYRQINVPAVRLEVRTSRDEGAGPITYLVDGDEALFMFKEFDGVWKIVMQEDLGG